MRRGSAFFRQILCAGFLTLMVIVALAKMRITRQPQQQPPQDQEQPAQQQKSTEEARGTVEVLDTLAVLVRLNGPEHALDLAEMELELVCPTGPDVPYSPIAPTIQDISCARVWQPSADSELVLRVDSDQDSLAAARNCTIHNVGTTTIRVPDHRRDYVESRLLNGKTLNVQAVRVFRYCSKVWTIESFCRIIEPVRSETFVASGDTFYRWSFE